MVLGPLGGHAYIRVHVSSFHIFPFPVVYMYVGFSGTAYHRRKRIMGRLVLMLSAGNTIKTSCVIVVGKTYGGSCDFWAPRWYCVRTCARSFLPYISISSGTRVCMVGLAVRHSRKREKGTFSTHSLLSAGNTTKRN